jgi:hypothetical protein
MSRYDICVLPFHGYLLKAKATLFERDETAAPEEKMVEDLDIEQIAGFGFEHDPISEK